MLEGDGFGCVRHRLRVRFRASLFNGVRKGQTYVIFVFIALLTTMCGAIHIGPTTQYSLYVCIHSMKKKSKDLCDTYIKH